MVHLVDIDGARSGRPAQPRGDRAEWPREWRSRSRSPAGMEGADNIRLAFAAGATRVVVSMALADDPDLLRACLDVAGDWLAVGLDPRPESHCRVSLAPTRAAGLDGPGRRTRRTTASAGWFCRTAERFRTSNSWPRLARPSDAELFVAGGSIDLDAITSLRDAGIAGIILGEPLLSGAVDFASSPGGRRMILAAPPCHPLAGSRIVGLARAAARPPARRARRRCRQSPPTAPPTRARRRRRRTPLAPAHVAARPTAARPRRPPARRGTVTVTMSTNFGDIVDQGRRRASAPIAAGAFVALAECGYYNNVIFHRVVPGLRHPGRRREYGREPDAHATRSAPAARAGRSRTSRSRRTYKRGTVAMARTAAAELGRARSSSSS